MPSGRKASLTDADAEAIRELHEVHPKMTYLEIGARYKVGRAVVARILCYSSRKLEMSRTAKQTKSAPRMPACTVQHSGSIISPIPLSRLMAGR